MRERERVRVRVPRLLCRRAGEATICAGCTHWGGIPFILIYRQTCDGACAEGLSKEARDFGPQYAFCQLSPRRVSRRAKLRLVGHDDTMALTLNPIPS